MPILTGATSNIIFTPGDITLPEAVASGKYTLDGIEH
jgi:hypothetical protein